MIMPKMGESVMECTILKWLKNEGDNISKDDSVVEIATDKVDTEIPSTYSGKLSKILVKEGEIVKVGKPIAIIETIKLLSEAKNTKPEKITACVLKRSRHEKIIKSLNDLKVKIKFISDGDVTGVISVVDPNSSIDISDGLFADIYKLINNLLLYVFYSSILIFSIGL